MSGKVRQRTAANAIESATISVNEKILKECHLLYTDPENGLITIAESLNLKLQPPRRKIVVMLMGNHSAGKSSFINWYIEEHVLRTGVAIETQGFTIVTSGRKRETLTGNATLHLYPYFKPLLEIDGCILGNQEPKEKFEEHCPGKMWQHEQIEDSLQMKTLADAFHPNRIVLPWAASVNSIASCPVKGCSRVIGYLTTEISTSKLKKFSLVTFVDTPGLVDGDMKYPFDVNEAISWIGGMADLTFVFFDPIGQALCKRTLNLVEKLNETNGDKIRFFLSKADEAGHESDRQRVMMQIVQELCKRPGLNKCGFDMPTIYLPQPNRPSRCVNQIDEVCKDIEKTINNTIQNTLNSLEKDCETIANLIDKALEDDDHKRKTNLKNSFRSAMLATCGLILPIIFSISYLTNTVSPKFFITVLGNTAADMLFLYVSPLNALWQIVPHDYKMMTLSFLLTTCAILMMIAKWTSCSVTTLKRKEKKILYERREYIQGHVIEKKQALYKEYLNQCIGDHEA